MVSPCGSYLAGSVNFSRHPHPSVGVPPCFPLHSTTRRFERQRMRSHVAPSHSIGDRRCFGHVGVFSFLKPLAKFLTKWFRLRYRTNVSDSTDVRVTRRLMNIISTWVLLVFLCSFGIMWTHSKRRLVPRLMISILRTHLEFIGGVHLERPKGISWALPNPAVR